MRQACGPALEHVCRKQSPSVGERRQDSEALAPQLPLFTLSSEFPSDALKICSFFWILVVSQSVLFFVSRLSQWSRSCVFSPKKHVPSNRCPIVALCDDCTNCVDLTCAVLKGYFWGAWRCFGRGKTPGRRRENDISKKQILRKSNYTLSLSVFNKNSTLKGKKTNEKNQNAKQCHDPYVFFRILYRFSIS